MAGEAPRVVPDAIFVEEMGKAEQEGCRYGRENNRIDLNNLLIRVRSNGRKWWMTISAVLEIAARLNSQTSVVMCFDVEKIYNN